MPAVFTAMMAERLQKSTGRPCVEAEHGMEIRPGHTYIAPGEKHLLIRSGGDRPVVDLKEGAPENFCRPSANPMLRSLVDVYGTRVLAVVLTGMGSDGLDGARAVAKGGGWIVAQDQETSVVWGMPGAIVQEGLANEVLPLDRVATAIERSIRRS